MADLSWTPANIIVPTGTNLLSKITAAAVTVAAGDFCTVNSSDEVILADADTSTTDGSRGLWVAANGAGPGQPVSLIPPGVDITVTSSLTQGVFYYLSSTAGKSFLVSDLASGDYVTVTGWGKSATVFRFEPTITRYTKP